MSAFEKLTAKQKTFVLEYVKDFNATAAAIRAGYSKNTARQMGSENLSKPDIIAALGEIQSDRQKRLEISADRVMQEIARVAFANAGDFFDWSESGVSLRDSTTLTRDQTAAVSEISQTITQHGGSVRLKLHDKLSALRDLGKHLGLFDDDGRDKRNADDVARDIMIALRAIDDRTGGNSD